MEKKQETSSTEQQTMKQDQLYAQIAAPNSIREDFAFTAQVAEVFDDMLDRSIPFYQVVIDGIAELIEHNLHPQFTIYDLGCSTGTTLLQVSRKLMPWHKEYDIRYIGIDNAPAMLEKARRKNEMFTDAQRRTFIEGDLTTCPLPGASAIICNYTLQFLRPQIRSTVVQGLYDALSPGGLLILSEKVIGKPGRLNRDFIDIYHNFKRQQGYSELEISAKREALENILIPFSPQENMTLLSQAGFSQIDIFFKWFNFASFVARKEDTP